MLTYKKEWKVIILVERSHKRDDAMFEVPNIRNNIVYKTEVFKWDLIYTKSGL